MVMPFEEFKYIMNQIQAHATKLERISDFFEKEMCSDSWCLVNIGEDLANTLCCMLADHFNCWWVVNDKEAKDKIDGMLEDLGLPPSKGSSLDWWDPTKRQYENDIEYWLYEDSKRIIVEGQEVPIATLEELYDYLIKYCVDKK